MTEAWLDQWTCAPMWKLATRSCSSRQAQAWLTTGQKVSVGAHFSSLISLCQLATCATLGILGSSEKRRTRRWVALLWSIWTVTWHPDGRRSCSLVAKWKSQLASKHYLDCFEWSTGCEVVLPDVWSKTYGQVHMYTYGHEHFDCNDEMEQ